MVHSSPLPSELTDIRLKGPKRNYERNCEISDLSKDAFVDKRYTCRRPSLAGILDILELVDVLCDYTMTRTCKLNDSILPDQISTFNEGHKKVSF